MRPDSTVLGLHPLRPALRRPAAPDGAAAAMRRSKGIQNSPAGRGQEIAKVGSMSVIDSMTMSAPIPG